MNVINDWKRSSMEVFWGEIAPCDHVVQIYENDGLFLDTLTGFVGGGVNKGDCVIVIATEAHLKALEDRLISFGISIDNLIQDDRYIPLDAEETLSLFMVNDWPDEELFNKTLDRIMEKANPKHRNVRAFGEMVALLWAKGLTGATVQLEHLWNRYCEQQSFSLFCAYPKIGLTQDLTISISDICNCHAKLINGTEGSLKEIVYQDIARKEAI